MSDLKVHVAGCPSAEALLPSLEGNVFGVAIQIANELTACSRSADALVFFRIAYEENKTSPHVMLRIIENKSASGQEVTEADRAEMAALEPRFLQFFDVKELLKKGGAPKALLEAYGDCFEAFDSGSEADWHYLRAAQSLVASEPMTIASAPKSENLFFYWDSDNPPEEVRHNFEHHRALGIFDVRVFSRESATTFLQDYFGSDTVTTFRSLRHPAEESDFFRLHAVYALGGYYIDVDEAVHSAEAFHRQFGTQLADTFVLSSTGPVENALFGACKGSPVLAEALRILLHNCYLRRDLSMWLKSGPGPITRALTRAYYLHLMKGEPLPAFHLLPDTTFPKVIRGVDVSYRNDARDWRVFEAQQAANA